MLTLSLSQSPCDFVELKERVDVGERCLIMFPLLFSLSCVCVCVGGVGQGEGGEWGGGTLLHFVICKNLSFPDVAQLSHLF